LRGGLREGRGGNPNLQPVQSENFDASLEYYFSRTGFRGGQCLPAQLERLHPDQTLPDFRIRCSAWFGSPRL
jgi:hypothetical protein